VAIHYVHAVAWNPLSLWYFQQCQQCSAHFLYTINPTLLIITNLGADLYSMHSRMLTSNWEKYAPPWLMISMSCFSSYSHIVLIYSYVHACLSFCTIPYQLLCQYEISGNLVWFIFLLVQSIMLSCGYSRSSAIACCHLWMVFVIVNEIWLTNTPHKTLLMIVLYIAIIVFTIISTLMSIIHWANGK
jgi:hypothetical protein